MKNDSRFNLSQAKDHNLNDPFIQNDSRLSQSNHESCSSHEFLQFRPYSHTQNAAESDDSGACSPPLWKNSPSPSQQPLLSHQIHRSLSPAARLQAITRGQKELMEMVKNMPESSYELSLKDLVEHHRIEAPAPPPPQQQEVSDQNLQQRVVVKVKRQESKKNEKTLVRNGSCDLERRGMFLNIVFPFSLQSKKKKNLDRNSSGGWVSLKPESVKGGGGSERDWWKKKFTGSSASDSSRISNNSGGGSSRSSSRGSSSGRSAGGGRKKNSSLSLTDCWPFFKSKRGNL